MTNQEILAVVHAAINRKPIQSRNKECIPGAWCDDDAPTWNFAGREYRVKPVPREWWIAGHFNGNTPSWIAYESKLDACEAIRYSPGTFVTHVREVV